MLSIKRHIKKKRGYLSSLLIPRISPSHCLLVEDKQRRSPRCAMYQRVYTKVHSYNMHTWTLIVALPCDKESEFAKFDTPQIKRFAQRLSLYVSVSHPLTFKGLGLLTMQIYKIMFT